MWMYLGVQSLVYHFWGHSDLYLCLSTRVVMSQAYLVIGCILVLLIVAYYFGVTVTLLSDFDLSKSCASTSPILNDIEISYWGYILR